MMCEMNPTELLFFNKSGEHTFSNLGRTFLLKACLASDIEPEMHRNSPGLSVDM